VEVSVRGYVEAAVARGERTAAILGREILPNIAGVVAADGGVRARNQQRAYVDRVAAGRGSPRPPVPGPPAPVPSPRASARHQWQTPDRFPGTESAAQPA